MSLTLHYAPDNASLCVRLALGHVSEPFVTRLVDRSRSEQRSDAYRALNPVGLIPVLETPDGPIFETAAILLWLSDRHPGTLLPAPDDPERGRALSWLFWLSNTLHPSLRMTFYPDQYHPAAPELFRRDAQSAVARHLTLIERHADDLRPLHHCYLTPMLRWLALYGDNARWFALADYPALLTLARRIEVTPTARAAIRAEGLGPTPFSAPVPARPPEGSAT